MTQFSVRHDQFESEAEALELARAAGLTPIAVDLEAPSSKDHWHDFPATVYLVEGSMTVTVADTGERCELVPGSSLSASAGIVHREEGNACRAVVALSCDPSTLTMPIDKDPAELPS